MTPEIETVIVIAVLAVALLGVIIINRETKRALNNMKLHHTSPESDYLPAIPPEDYRGSVAEWMVKLQERGLWDGEGSPGDVMIDAHTWWEILEECESDL